MSDLAQVLFSVPSATAETVANLLMEHVGAGIEQRDADTLNSPAAPDMTDLIVWMPADQVAPRVADVKRLMDSLGEMGSSVDSWSWRSEEADPSTWVDAYKRFFKVTRLGQHLVVKPSWEEYTPAGGELLIEIDPGLAFGTGLHASTRLVARALERCSRLGPQPSSVLDVGCGTGILAIAAALLWPGCDVLAIDNDPTAVEVARENIARNGFDRRIHVQHRSAADLRGHYNVITANLSFETLRELYPALSQRLDSFGRLLLSGLLCEQARAIGRLYTRELAVESEFSEDEGDWRALILRART